MASRKQAKEEASRPGEAESQTASTDRRRRLALFAGAFALAAVIVVVLAVINSDEEVGDEPAASSSSAPAGSTTATSSGAAADLDGIPQRGNALGDPDAPLTLVEFADPQCPFCAQYSSDVLPELISRYVETGDLRMELELLTFIGPDSEKIARAAYAASLDDRFWDFTELAFARQGTENSDYATDEFLLGIAEEVGVDPDGFLERAASDGVGEDLRNAGDAASSAQIQSTPSFLIGPTGGKLEPLDVTELDPAAFSDAIDQRLASVGQ